VSSGAVRRPARTRASWIAIRAPVDGDARYKVDAGIRQEGFGHAQPLRLRERVGLAAAKAKAFGTGLFRGERQEFGAIIHQALVGLADAVPFEHGEFGMVERAALSVAPDRAEAEDAPLAGGEQLLAGEFRRGVKVKRLARSIGTDSLGGEG